MRADEADFEGGFGEVSEGADEAEAEGTEVEAM